MITRPRNRNKQDLDKILQEKSSSENSEDGSVIELKVTDATSV